MGFSFTVFYICILYLTPEALAPSLAPYRIEVWVGVIALLASIPAMTRDSKWRIPQLALLGGLLVSVALSQILAITGWAVPSRHSTILFPPALFASDRR